MHRSSHVVFLSKRRRKRHDKPLNVIYIMADDHAYQAISAYDTDLSDLAPTPTLIALLKMVRGWTKCIAQTAFVAPVVLPF